MAISIIDALVVTLGLDPSGFKKGKAEADAGLKDTKNIATGAAEEIVGGIGKMALAFTSLFVAVRGVTDVVDFFKDLNHQISDLGYTSRQLGETAPGLRLYQQVAEGFGGTAKGVTGTVASLEQALFQMRQMGTMSDILVAWQRFGGGLPKTNAQGGIDLMASIGQARRAVTGLPAQEANQRLIAMGLDEGTRNAILASTSDLAKWTEAQKKSAKEVGGNTKAAQDLERSWLQLKNDAVGLSATVLGQTTPALEAMFSAIDKWGESETFLETLNQIGAALKGIGGFAKDIQAGNWGTALGNAAGGLWDWVKGGINTKGNNITSLSRIHYASYFTGLEKQYRLPPGLLDKVVTAESHYDENAVSKTGARGLFLLDPKYFHDAGKNVTGEGGDAHVAAAYLAKLHQQFGGDKGDPDWTKAVAALHGPGALKGALSGKDGAAGEATNAAAGRYIDKVLGAGATPPTSSTRGPMNLSIGHITLNLPNAKDADDISNDLADAIQRRFNVFQTDAGMV